MSLTLRAMFPALLLSLSLTQTLPAVAADTAPATPAADTPVERPPLLSREQEEAQALERRLPAQDLQQLQAGDTPFLALWQPANSDDPQGAVIIVAGAGESADWPQVVGPLRRKFPDIGWATLSLPLPDTQDPALLARETEPAPDAAAPAKDATSEASPDAASPPPDALANQAAANRALAQAEAEQIFARIDSAIAFALQNKARSIVLLGHNSGAYWATRFANERADAKVQKLVLVAAREPQDAVPSLLELIPNLKVKTADFIYKNRQGGNAEQRLQTSKRTKGPGYTQIGLVDIAGNAEAEQEQIFRRIRGWVQAE
ncbi:alpha/beta hydrolase family protein [Pseudomonas ovata]|uniref:alpha/beta hydrolase family protein n=1 Tax=Pseudomonas ovata TaxID=1839709 RepID=UPI000D687FBE|nr:alpha/beta hydrolase family protein [Pseudomonas ovata]